MAEPRPLREILAQTDPRHAASFSPPGNSAPPSGKRGVPGVRLDNTFENFRRSPDMEAAYVQCEKVADGEARCALLAGSFGNGKTHLAIAALRRWNNMETGWFWKVPELLQAIKTRAFDGEESVDDVIRPW